MPLGQPTSTGGGFLNFKELVDRADGPVFIFARVAEFKPKETDTKRSERGPVLPVVADIKIATGPDAGTLHPLEEIIGAPTAALRGVKNPSAKNGWTIAEPVNKVGTTYPFVVSIGNNAGNDYVKFDAPRGAHWDQASSLYEQFGEEDMWTSKAPEVPAPRAAEPVTASAAAGGDRKKPW